MSSRNGHRPPRGGAKDDDVVVLAPSWPLLPETEYRGTVIKYEIGYAPWAARKPRIGETAKRRDWHVYYHVRLDVGQTPDGCDAIAEYQREHAGALPVTYLACRFSRVRPDDPIRPGRTSKLHRLLLLVAGTRLLGEIRLGSVVGQRIRVQLRTVDTDRDGLKLPIPLWRSTVERIVELLPPDPPEATSSKQQAVSKKQPAPPIVVVDTAVSDSTTSMAGQASRRRGNQSASQATAPAEVGALAPVGADAELAPVLVEVNPWTR